MVLELASLEKKKKERKKMTIFDFFKIGFRPHGGQGRNQQGVAHLCPWKQDRDCSHQLCEASGMNKKWNDMHDCVHVCV